MFNGFHVRLTLVVFVGCMSCSARVLTSDVSAQTTQSPMLRILFPAYANPYRKDGQQMWAKLAALSLKRPPGLEIDIIFNPASGPGTARDFNYLNDDNAGPLADVQGLRVLGYVTTSYAKRPIDDVKKEIDIYATGFYAGFVIGIFFDETSSSLDTAGYYRELHEYAQAKIKTRDGTVAPTVTNPGIGEVQPPVTEDRLRAYAMTMDRIIVFEHDASKYRDAAPAAVAPFLKPENLVHIVHSQPTWSPGLLALMQRRGAANVFITDDVMANPYDKLPAYFDQLCEAVAASNLTSTTSEE